MKNNLNINKILNVLSSRLINYTKISDGIITKEKNEIILTNDDKLYETFNSLEISFPYFPMMPDVREEHITEERKELVVSKKTSNEIRKLFKIIGLYIANDNEIKNFFCGCDISYLLEYNNILYQLSYNLTENKISKLSEITIDDKNQLTNVITFNNLNTFYKNQKNIKIKRKQKKD